MFYHHIAQVSISSASVNSFLSQVHIFQVSASISTHFQIQISVSVGFCSIINQPQVQWHIITALYYFAYDLSGRPGCCALDCVLTHWLCGEGNGNPLQYSCPGNPMDRGAWYATVHGVTKSRTRLRNLNLLIYAVYKRPTSNLGKHID